MEFIGAVALAFGAVFVAEFGDKSQLLTLAFATRYPWRPVVLGVVIAAVTIQGLSVAVGAAVGSILPPEVVSVVAGVVFLGVAAWTLLGGEEEAEDAAVDEGARRTGPGLVALVAGTFIVAELGDKTMLATFALAASQGALSTWVGAATAMVTANLVAVVIGQQVGQRISPRLIRYGSAGLFAAAGLVVLAGAVAG